MVILLNGCINSGKTTVGRALAARNIGLAHVEVDQLRQFINWMPLRKSLELNLENAAAVAINFHRRGIDSVITYPLAQENYEFIYARLQAAGIEVYAITLFPGFEQLKQNRGTRALSDWELSRIDEQIEEGLATPVFSVIIDNATQSVSETTTAVLRIAGFSPQST